MHMIPIPSLNCPHCKNPKTECSLIMVPIETMSQVGLKPKEKDFIKEMQAEVFGKRLYTSREAYMFQKIICSNRKDR